MSKYTFEDFLMEKHAEQHIGTKETLVDGYSDWLVALDPDDFLKYGDMFAREQSKGLISIKNLVNRENNTYKTAYNLGLKNRKGNELDYSKAICHCNYDEAHCPGIFTYIKKGEIVCNECGIPLTEMIKQAISNATEAEGGE